VEEQVLQTKEGKRSLVGIVTSDKMDKTIVVSINTKKNGYPLQKICYTNKEV